MVRGLSEILPSTASGERTKLNNTSLTILNMQAQVQIITTYKKKYAIYCGWHM